MPIKLTPLDSIKHANNLTLDNQIVKRVRKISLPQHAAKHQYGAQSRCGEVLGFFEERN
ncbi:MAG: hypothetical protein KTR16_05055 [Acidiferrobacterales bacterium]|nr:hypothetical protein [Acidiferrobacterales bacterium]